MVAVIICCRRGQIADLVDIEPCVKNENVGGVKALARKLHLLYVNIFLQNKRHGYCLVQHTCKLCGRAACIAVALCLCVCEAVCTLVPWKWSRRDLYSSGLTCLNPVSALGEGGEGR